MRYTRIHALSAAAELRECGFITLPTGSAYFNDDGGDIDLIVDRQDDAVGRLLAAGYLPCARSEYPDDSMWTGRAGPINVIVPLTAEAHERWVRATLACAILAYTGVHLDKNQRIGVFRAVVDTEHPVDDLRQHALSQVAVW